MIVLRKDRKHDVNNYPVLLSFSKEKKTILKRICLFYSLGTDRVDYLNRTCNSNNCSSMRIVWKWKQRWFRNLEEQFRWKSVNAIAAAGIVPVTKLHRRLLLSFIIFAARRCPIGQQFLVIRLRWSSLKNTYLEKETIGKVDFLFLTHFTD